MLIATIRARSADDAIRDARQAAADSDLLELRLDDLSPGAASSLDAWLSRLPAPAIATCRRRADGGGFRGSEEERRALLESAARAGTRFVDVEAGTEVARRIALPDRVRRVISCHAAGNPPDDLGALVASMDDGRPAAYRKVVTTARRLSDNLAMRDLLRGGAPGAPLIAFCMGEAGKVSRLLALAWGSAATYGSAGARAGAPGQIPVAEMTRLYRVREIDARTGLIGILGAPLGHSLSPRAHNAALAGLRLDAVYLPLESDDLELALAVARTLGVARLSVTHPHKTAILSHLDDMEPLVRRIGAANTVIPSGDRRIGLNTDARGGLRALRDRLPSAGAEVALLGAGGAARAVAWGLVAAGARVTVFARRPGAAASLAAAGVALRPLVDLADHRYDVLVNATPVGMSLEAEASPIPAEWLRGRLVHDLVYNPPETKLLRQARARDIATLSGIEMFLGQATEQFELYTGRTPPPGVMRAAVGEALGRAQEEGAGGV